MDSIRVYRPEDVGDSIPSPERGPGLPDQVWELEKRVVRLEAELAVLRHQVARNQGRGPKPA